MRLPSLFLLLLTASACSLGFDPYNEVIGFRVLAIRADKPTLQPREQAQLDALIHLPASDPPVEYAWSWCPFRGSAETKYDCAVSEAELQKQIDEAVGPGALTVPPYALSNAATATFVYDLPPQLFAGLCAALQGQMLPEFVAAPDCDGTFEITIRLIARSGDKEIISLKELSLAYVQDASINTNPQLGDVYLWSSDQDESAAMLLEPGTTPALTRDKAHGLKIDIDEGAAELVPGTGTGTAAVAPRREILFATWFTQGGSTDSQRTSFIDGEIPFENLLKNELTTPREPDYPASVLKLYFVLRDTRGGVDFTERTVILLEP